MRVTIPDDLADALQAKLKPAQTLDGEITRLLTACSGVPAGDQVVVLDSARLNELAGYLGRPSLASYTDLLSTVQRLAGLSFGQIRFGFSPGQLEEIAHKAQREGMSMEEYAGRIIRNLTSSFFTTAPARDDWPEMLVERPVKADDQVVEIQA